jgi:putative pyruvate formate lyase activating enzyme
MLALSDKLSLEELEARLDALFAPCGLCEVRCGAMRSQGQEGPCGLADEVHVYNRLLHMGEEAPLVPSLAVFLSGCSMRCSFCSEAEHLRPPFRAKPVSPQRLAEQVAGDLARAGREVRNINFVGGEPSIALPFLARFARALAARVPSPPPLLLNTNGYLTPEALVLATHLCPIWVVDLKFGQDRCGREVGAVAQYSEVLRRNLSWLHDPGTAPPHEGVYARPVQLWVRHLLMPGHLECCTKPCLDWLAAHTPQARVNLMPAFHPFDGPGNARWASLSAQERDEGLALLRASGLTRAWFDGRRLEASP